MVRHCSTTIVSDLALKGHNVSKCPRGMWTYLVNRFEKVSGTTKMIAFNQLVDTKMDINNVEKFISEYEKGIQVARMAGINLNDEIIYLRFVHQICDELEATRNRLQEKDDFEEAKEILRAETKRYLEKEKSETAMKASWQTRGRQSGSKVPYCGKCGIKGHWLKDCNPQAIKCFGCGQSGHIVARCPEKGKNNDNISKYVCSSFVSLFSGTGSNEYYLDSGASDHFVNEPSAFTGLRQMHSTEWHRRLNHPGATRTQLIRKENPELPISTQKEDSQAEGENDDQPDSLEETTANVEGEHQYQPEEEEEEDSESDESSSEEEGAVAEGNASEQTLELKEIPKVERFCGVEIEFEEGKFLLGQTLLIDELAGAYGLAEGREYADSPLPEWGDYSEGEADMNLPIKNLIGSLQFIASRTRPDIAASLNYLSRQTSKPTQRLFNACKYLLRYVKKTRDLKLILGQQSQESLVIFTDASHAPLPDRKSITGVVVQLFGSTVAWASKRQPTEVALSSSEA
ncbi:hypothetical protein TYRP_006473, partial [Tyrophagus putrescentiae]